MQQLLDWGLILIFPLIFLIAVIWMNASAVMQYQKVKELNKTGIRTQAIITKKDFSHYPKGPDAFRLDYAYQAESQEFVVSKEVDESIYNLYAEGDLVSIYYQKDRPNISDIAGNDNYLKSAIIAVILDVILLVLFFVFYFKKG